MVLWGACGGDSLRIPSVAVREPGKSGKLFCPCGNGDSSSFLFFDSSIALLLPVLPVLPGSRMLIKHG